ncbi:mechanosensitive ion channel family protein [Marinagarivorans cellulosilyticus]|uniref:MscS family membrane protein n=1 Tax=Marinagarivorans cellulosilyticus TaxID=2721545 RepID=A0AAN1WJD4_9GAMM|nr:mechanosensitive ion channel family protein [Marinagarivorans cellulosilyticus]BCD98723.1 MscS family membrane protein [Marinagarivorans cellulosilyticus]
MLYRITLALCLMLSMRALAEDPTVKELLDADQRSEQVIISLREQPTAESSPLSTMATMVDAIRRDDWVSAAEYMDMRYLPAELSAADPVILLQRLAVVWGQHQLVDLSALSHSPEGDLADGLPDYRELLGSITLDKQVIPIYLQRVPDGKGGRVWKVSNATIGQIPKLWAEFGYHPLVLKIADYIPAFSVLHMQNWQVIGLVVLICAAWFLSALIRWILLRLVSFSEKYREGLQRFFTVPLRWFLFFKFLESGIAALGLPLKARVYLNDGTLSYIASTFLVLAAIEFATAVFLSNSANKRYWSGIIRPVRTILKILAVITILLMWLSDAGYNISTLLAGLGIGSLALALAAQKTLENVIGAITLYIAKPIAPGDYCKFGDVSGTVEEIGLRSTAIRRLDRTLVHVPNSAIVGVNLENISETDRRRYNKQLWVAIGCSADQLRLAILKMRELLLSHPKVLDTALRVRFDEIERDAYRIGLNAYIGTSSMPEFLAVSEDINFRLLGILESTGLQLALPQQRIVLERPDQTEGERIASIRDESEKEIQALLEQETLGFPDYSADRKAELRGSIQYPEKGCAQLGE